MGPCCGTLCHSMATLVTFDRQHLPVNRHWIFVGTEESEASSTYRRKAVNLSPSGSTDKVQLLSPWYKGLRDRWHLPWSRLTIQGLQGLWLLKACFNFCKGSLPLDLNPPLSSFYISFGGTYLAEAQGFTVQQDSFPHGASLMRSCLLSAEFSAAHWAVVTPTYQAKPLLQNNPLPQNNKTEFLILQCPFLLRTHRFKKVHQWQQTAFPPIGFDSAALLFQSWSLTNNSEK